MLGTVPFLPPHFTHSTFVSVTLSRYCTRTASVENLTLASLRHDAIFAIAQQSNATQNAIGTNTLVLAGIFRIDGLDVASGHGQKEGRGCGGLLGGGRGGRDDKGSRPAQEDDKENGEKGDRLGHFERENTV